MRQNKTTAQIYALRVCISNRQALFLLPPPCSDEITVESLTEMNILGNYRIAHLRTHRHNNAVLPGQKLFVTNDQ